jgi:hypothetical protein
MVSCWGAVTITVKEKVHRVSWLSSRNDLTHALSCYIKRDHVQITSLNSSTCQIGDFSTMASSASKRCLCLWSKKKNNQNLQQRININFVWNAQILLVKHVQCSLKHVAQKLREIKRFLAALMVQRESKERENNVTGGRLKTHRSHRLKPALSPNIGLRHVSFFMLRILSHDKRTHTPIS